MPDMLQEIFEMQAALQVRFDTDPRRMNRLEVIEYIRWNVLALEDELHEALQEMGWKPWSTSRHLNREEYVGELIDALHFLVNLFLAAAVEPEEVMRRYVMKHHVNRQRQENGYTGLEKDEHGRAVDEPVI